MTATWPHPLPEPEVDRRILMAREWNADGRALVLAITRKKQPDRLIGMVGLHEEGDTDLGIGFMLDPEFHSRSIMTEAVRGVIDTVLAFAPYSSVRGSCVIANPASRRVFEKVGFAHVGEAVHDAPARERPQPCSDFELTRAAWHELVTAQRQPSMVARGTEPEAHAA